MSNLLFLSHRLPYPPNKGDKVRSYHLLKALAREHRIFLGTFVDDPEDERHVDALRPLCADIRVCRLYPARAKLRSLTGFATGEALTLPYYRNRELAGWVERTAAEADIDTAVVFSSPMAQYVERLAHVRMLVDFVDVDSDKWRQYAAARRWPGSYVYAREASKLLAAERAIAARAYRSFFVTPAETTLFQTLAPECAEKVEPLSNGVDSEYFAPHPDRASPYEPAELPLVFTGAMDYWPNVDAAEWFASSVLPRIKARVPSVRFYIVGMRPTVAVRALASPDVVVTGTVPDVRPYVQHAAIVVAPLRIARGIQNKVLEAMAMGKAVVTSKACAEAIEGATPAELASALGETAFADAVVELLDDSHRARTMGEAARRFVREAYSWDSRLARIRAYVAADRRQEPGAAPVANTTFAAAR